MIVTGLADHYFDRENQWSWQQLYRLYKDHEFKVGEDDKGKKIRIKLKHYLEYMVY